MDKKLFDKIMNTFLKDPLKVKIEKMPKSDAEGAYYAVYEPYSPPDENGVVKFIGYEIGLEFQGTRFRVFIQKMTIGGDGGWQYTDVHLDELLVDDVEVSEAFATLEKVKAAHKAERLRKANTFINDFMEDKFTNENPIVRFYDEQWNKKSAYSSALQANASVFGLSNLND